MLKTQAFYTMSQNSQAKNLQAKTCSAVLESVHSEYDSQGQGSTGNLRLRMQELVVTTASLLKAIFLSCRKWVQFSMSSKF